jgi:hypothetical protein
MSLLSLFSRVKALLNAPHGPVQLGWVIESPGSLTKFLRQLRLLVPEDALLYIDMLGVPEIQRYAEEHRVRGGIDFPKGWSNIEVTFPHLPIREEVLSGLADVCETHHPAEITSEIIVYRGKEVLVTWHDLPDDPIYVSVKVDEACVHEFCRAAGCRYSSGKTAQG